MPDTSPYTCIWNTTPDVWYLIYSVSTTSCVQNTGPKAWNLVSVSQIHFLTDVYGIQQPIFGILSIMRPFTHLYEMLGLKPGISCQIHFHTLVECILYSQFGVWSFIQLLTQVHEMLGLEPGISMSDIFPFKSLWKLTKLVIWSFMYLLTHVHEK